MTIFSHGWSGSISHDGAWLLEHVLNAYERNGILAVSFNSDELRAATSQTRDYVEGIRNYLVGNFHSRWMKRIKEKIETLAARTLPTQNPSIGNEVSPKEAIRRDVLRRYPVAPGLDETFDKEVIYFFDSADFHNPRSLSNSIQTRPEHERYLREAEISHRASTPSLPHASLQERLTYQEEQAFLDYRRNDRGVKIEFVRDASRPSSFQWTQDSLGNPKVVVTLGSDWGATLRGARDFLLTVSRDILGRHNTRNLIFDVENIRGTWGWDLERQRSLLDWFAGEFEGQVFDVHRAAKEAGLRALAQRQGISADRLWHVEYSPEGFELVSQIKRNVPTRYLITLEGSSASQFLTPILPDVPMSRGTTFIRTDDRTGTQVHLSREGVYRVSSDTPNTCEKALEDLQKTLPRLLED